ncbi:MAG: 2-phospho-L-lactate guanylyltransferase [Actinobacteria bacterium]|nr:2-phospho-L-lactate guanylyltransferase [Actinomycetota bacterium]
MTARTVALIPLRDPGSGKSRLAPALDRDERAALAEAMLADVVQALTDAVDDVVLLASGSQAAVAGQALGLDVLLDDVDTPGLNPALAVATRRLSPNAARIVVVVADLPCLQSADVNAVLADEAPVVVAPTADGGTAVLLRVPGEVITTAYGPDSAVRHLELARNAGVTSRRIDRPGTELDVDTVGDLAALAAAPVGPSTRGWLADADLARPVDADGPALRTPGRPLPGS